MNEQLVFQILSFTTMFLQAIVVIMGLVAFGQINDRKSWRWFVGAALMVFVRRFTGLIEAAYNIDTNLIEYFETILISVFWILFIRTFTKNCSCKKI